MVDPALAGNHFKAWPIVRFLVMQGSIDTVSKAVLVLGITEVYNLVIAFFTKKAFKELDVDQDYLDEFWCKSVDCALIAKYIGAKLNIRNPERVFILGLLHNLGELAVKKISPEQLALVSITSEFELPWEKQKHTLGFTFGECSAALLKQWQLPPSIIEPISNQDNVGFDRISDDTKLLYLAKRIMLTMYECPSHAIELLITDERISTISNRSKLYKRGY